MKKIVSAFLLVFMFSVFSVTGFAADIYKSASGHSTDYTSLSIFEKKNFGSESFYDQYFILPTEQYATFKIKFDNSEYLTDKFDIVFIGQRVIHKSGSTGFIPLPDGNQEKIIKTIHNVSITSLKDWYSVNVVLKNYYPEFNDEFFQIQIGYLNQDENGNIPSSPDLNTQLGIFSSFNFTMGTPVDPPYMGDIKVKWKNFGDRTTDTGINEYLDLTDSTINLEIFSGNNTGRLNLVVNEVDSNGVPISSSTKVISPNEMSSIPINTTLNFNIDLKKYITLKNGSKYTISLVHPVGEDVETVSKIGFISKVEFSSVNERKVAWTTFGNRTTKEGEYLTLDSLFMNFQLYTGDFDNHSYGAYIQEFNKKGQTVGDKVDIISDFFSNPLKKYSTYNMSFYLPKHLSLDGGHKFVFYIKDITNGEIVSSIGFSPVIGIRKRNDVPPNLEIMTEIPNDSVDTEIKPPFSDIGTGDNPNFPSENFPETGGIGEKISWFFNSILNVINVIFSSFTNLLDVVSSSCTSFVNFLGSMFPYLPKELTMCISLGFTAIIVLRFLKR